MKLLTHNMLICNKKGCGENSFPLKIEASAVDKREFEFDPDFVRRMIATLSWPGLVSAAKDLSFTIPEQLPANANEDEALLRNIHEVLNEVSVTTGKLICNNCGRNFPIEFGIPNMLLTEEEV